MVDRILVPVDGTEHSDRALEFACCLAKPLGSMILLLHVPFKRAGMAELADVAKRCSFYYDIENDLGDVQIIAPVAPMSTPVVVLPAGLVEKVGYHLVKRARAMLEANGFKDVSALIEPGNAADVIIEQVKEQQVDLVVMGSRGFGDIKSVFLGSVSHKVAQECSCPCTTVK